MPGAWSMTDDGEFILNEPFKTQLFECKVAGAMAFQDAAFDYLSERTGYGIEELREAYEHYACNEELPHIERMDQFVVSALEGDL